MKSQTHVVATDLHGLVHAVFCTQIVGRVDYD